MTTDNTDCNNHHIPAIGMPPPPPYYNHGMGLQHKYHEREREAQQK